MRKFISLRWLALLPLVLLAGCDFPGAGVALSVERQLSNIVFGEPTEPKVPKATPNPQGALAGPDTSFFHLGEQVNFVYPYAPRRRAFQSVSCSTAPPGAPAAEAAGSNSEHPPTAGTYRWLAEYTTNVNRASTTVDEFENRKVQNVKQQADTQSQFSSFIVHHWTFDTVQPDPDPLNVGGTVVTSFVVKTWSDINNPSTPAASAQGSGNSDPNGGVALHMIQRLNRSGTPVETFAPTTSGTPYAPAPDPNNPFPNGPGGGSGDLLLFTLPTQANNFNHWDFTAVDPASQWTMDIAGTTNGRREFVDACGEVVEAWPVEAEVTISKTDPATHAVYQNLHQHWSYDVATQWGGLLIKFAISGTGKVGSGDTTYGTISTAEKLARVRVDSS